MDVAIERTIVVYVFLTFFNDYFILQLLHVFFHLSIVYIIGEW